MLMRSRRIQWNGCRVHDAASGLWSGSSITGGLRRADAGLTVIPIGAYKRKALCRLSRMVEKVLKDKMLNDIEIVIINKNLND